MLIYLVSEDYEYPHLICATLDLAMKLEEQRHPMPGRETRWDHHSFQGEEVWRREEFTVKRKYAPDVAEHWADLGVRIEQHEIRES